MGRTWRSLRHRLAQLAPYLAAGPITGPFLAGAIRNWREGRPLLATLYALAALEITILAPWLLGRLALNAL